MEQMNTLAWLMERSKPFKIALRGLPEGVSEKEALERFRQLTGIELEAIPGGGHYFSWVPRLGRPVRTSNGTPIFTIIPDQFGAQLRFELQLEPAAQELLQNLAIERKD